MILLVMGMGRSGTSLLMQVLQAAGFDCGSRWIADNENNPRGYFEMKSVMNFNIRILQQASGDTESLYPLPDEKAIEDCVGTHIPIAFPQHDFAVKDPRFSLTLPVWEPVLRDQDCRIIFSRRNPEAIAESMARAYRMDLQTSREIIDYYIQRAEQNIARFHFPCVDVQYEDWFSNPKTNLKKLETLTGRTLFINLEEVLDPDLYHCKGEKTVSKGESGNLFECRTDAEKENWLTLESLQHPLHTVFQQLKPEPAAQLIWSGNGKFHGQYETQGKTIQWTVPAEFRPETFPSIRYRGYTPEKQWLFIAGIDAVCPFSLQAADLSLFSPIIIIEPDLIKLQSYFKIHSYIQLFQFPNVYWFVGENAFQNCMEALDNEIEPYFVLPSGVFPVFGDLVVNETAPQTKQFMRAFQQKAKEKFIYFRQAAEAFKQKFQSPAANQKVMMVIPSVACWIVLGHGVAHGFRENGLEVFEYRVPFPPDKITAYDTLHLLKTVRQWSPDFLFTLSHASDLFVRGIKDIPIKRIVWYVDEPDHLIQQKHGPYDDIYYSWKEFGERLQNRNGNLKDEMLVGAFPLPYVQKEPLQCDVCFVGSIEDQSFFRMQCPDELLSVLDRIVEQKLSTIKQPIHSLIDSSGLSEEAINIVTDMLNPTGLKLGMTPMQVLILYLHQECIRRRRLELLLALGGFDIKIYGNSAWNELLRDTPVEGAFQGRGISYDECCNLYASSRISLNIHPPYLHSGPNQRDIDIPVCDGFLLTDLHLHAGERMKEFFEPETEIALYEDANELRQKVEYYLDHPDERRAITEAAKARIQTDHTFTRRVKPILKNL